MLGLSRLKTNKASMSFSPHSSLLTVGGRSESFTLYCEPSQEHLRYAREIPISSPSNPDALNTNSMSPGTMIAPATCASLNPTPRDPQSSIDSLCMEGDPNTTKKDHASIVVERAKQDYVPTVVGLIGAAAP